MSAPRLFASRISRAALCLCAVAALLASLAVAPCCWAQTVWGHTSDGSEVDQLAPADAQVLVLFFVASDCPISNRTFPEMRRLRETYAARGASFWYVYPNSNETAQSMAAHQRDYDPDGRAILAPGPEIVRLAHAYATPEIAVLKRAGATGWKVAYAGRVDNRYVRFGLERPQATERFGEDAIAAVLAGRAPKPATGTLVGCAILNPGARP